MKNTFRIVWRLVLVATLGVTLVARANPVNVYTVSDPIQDDWILANQVEELGLAPVFPTDERIGATNVLWGGHVPCPASSGDWFVQVQMTNRTGIDWPDVWYVGDPETSLANWDEMVGQVGYTGLGLAFKIDSIGENTPLVYESIAYDDIFQAGEVWQFVIQEYTNSFGGPAWAFNSLGVAGASSGYPPSTGSILVPEPTTFSLLALAGLALLWRKRS